MPHTEACQQQLQNLIYPKHNSRTGETNTLHIKRQIDESPSTYNGNASWPSASTLLKWRMQPNINVSWSTLTGSQQPRSGGPGLPFNGLKAAHYVPPESILSRRHTGPGSSDPVQTPWPGLHNGKGHHIPGCTIRDRVGSPWQWVAGKSKSGRNAESGFPPTLF